MLVGGVDGCAGAAAVVLSAVPCTRSSTVMVTTAASPSTRRESCRRAVFVDIIVHVHDRHRCEAYVA